MITSRDFKSFISLLAWGVGSQFRCKHCHTTYLLAIISDPTIPLNFLFLICWFQGITWRHKEGACIYIVHMHLEEFSCHVFSLYFKFQPNANGKVPNHTYNKGVFNWWWSRERWSLLLRIQIHLCQSCSLMGRVFHCCCLLKIFEVHPLGMLMWGNNPCRIASVW